MPETKQCTKCGETKPLTDYHRNKNRKDGHASICKTCRNVYTNPQKLPAGHRLRAENAQRYREVVAHLHDERTDREPKKGECAYSGCGRKQDPENDPHGYGFCTKHGENAAKILGYKLTA